MDGFAGMNVYCLTNEKHYWLLPGFLHLFREYWPWVSENLTVVGYGNVLGAVFRQAQQSCDVPFISIAPANYPANRWTDGLIEFLQRLEDEYLVLMLEDYWLTAPVAGQVAMLMNAVQNGVFGERFLRLDLSADRASQTHTLHKRGAGYDIISTPSHSPYQMSFQAAIWHRRNLLSVLVRGETPWEAEVNGSKRLASTDLARELLVLGTLQRPVKYQPVYRSHRKRLDLGGIPAEQLAIMRMKGILTTKEGRWV